MRRHQPARLVIEEQPRALPRRQHRAVDRDHVVGGDVERRRIDDAAVDGDAALHDHLLGIPARSQPGACQHLGDPLAALLRFRLLARGALVDIALVEVALALAILASAAERRTLGEDLAVVFIVAAGPVIAARMLLPIPAALGALTTWAAI